MKRTDVTDIFPDATKEQIDKLLGINGADINGADINGAKGDLAGLQGQLADAQKQIEKLQQGSGQSDQLAAANKAIKDLQAELKGINGADINGAKGDLAGLQGQLADAQKQIEKLLGINGADINGADINGAKGDLAGLQGQLADAQKQIEKLQQGSGQSDQLAAANKAIKDLQAELKGMKDAENLRQIRDKVAADKKIPANLLTGDTEEACVAQADSILAFAQSHGYPAVPDGGEVNSSRVAGDKVAAGYAKLSADLFGEK